MTNIFFYNIDQEDRSKRCKLLMITSALKDVLLSSCHTCKPRPSNFPVGPDPISDFDHQQEEIVSAIRKRAMEAKFRRKIRNAKMTAADSFSSSVFEPNLGVVDDVPSKQEELIVNKSAGHEQEDKEEFLSVGTHFSCSCSCSTVADSDAFFSTTTFWRYCPNPPGEVDNYFQQLEYQRRRSTLLQCQGWPFGLCRKALLLPPLPTSPSQSWSWRKAGKN